MNRNRTLAAVLVAMLPLSHAAIAIEPMTQPLDARTIPESDYVIVRDGHLFSQGRRQRYWAVIGKLFASANVKATDSPQAAAEKTRLARAGTDLLVQRFEDLGFNAVRLWHGFPEADSTYAPGDGSSPDDVDYFVARAKASGFRIWLAAFSKLGDVTPDDVSILDDPATAEAWQAAIRDAGGKLKLQNNPARIWDPRLETIGIQRMTNMATHYNPYTGLRWCDDPVFAVWELSNEEWWVRRMLGGSWQKLPTYFRNDLVHRWNAFLLSKYGDQAGLLEAWGSLLPSESLEYGTVLLAPMDTQVSAGLSINDASQHARAALDNMQQSYRREDFLPQRGADVLAFLTELVIAHKQREAAAIKPLGRSTSLSPMIFDTGIGYRIQSQYMHQFADAVAHDAYVNGVGRELWEKIDAAEGEVAKMQATLEAERQAPNAGRWNNWLLKPPGIAQGVPWLEHNKPPNMPFLCYETQIQQPAKYRADFPLRLLALAATQDWDWICWHYFGDNSLNDIAGAQRPFDRPMDVTISGHPQGYHFTYDEVQSAMMRAAGYAFRHGAFDPAPQPTQFIFGRKSLFDPDSMPYGGSYGKLGMDMLQTTYEYGVRLWIDPNRDTDEVIGPRVSFDQRHTHNPYRPTPQITFNHEQGWLQMDSPGCAVFAGLLARHGDEVDFAAAGVQLRDVTILNPEGIFDPVGAGENYVAFAIYALDGKPLSETNAAALSIVSASFNSGFMLGEGERKTVKGDLPVLVARVAATIQAPAIKGMSYEMLDWHMQKIGEGTVNDGSIGISADQPVFVVTFHRPDRE